MSGETERNISGWTVDTLKEYVEQRFMDSEKAVNSALEAANKAVEKAEANAEKWRMNANEWRGAMNDRERTLMPRQESESALKSVNDKIDALQARMERNEGRSSMAYPAFEQLMKDTASLTQARSEGSGEKSGRVSQQQMLMMVVSLVGSLILIGGVVIAIAFAIRR